MNVSSSLSKRASFCMHIHLPLRSSTYSKQWVGDSRKSELLNPCIVPWLLLLQQYVFLRWTSQMAVQF